MPRRDGTGPMGQGAMTGRGLGYCTGANINPYYGRAGVGFGYGRGLGYGRGFGRGLGLGYRFGRFFGAYNPGYTTQATEKEVLMQEKDILQSRLDAINQQLKEENK